MAHELLWTHPLIVFSTRDFSTVAGISVSAATHQLTRLAVRGVLVRVTRGVWANVRHPHFTPLGAIPLLLGTEQGYVSFLTALHLHGMVSQIPTAYQVATTGQPRVLLSPIGRFEFFQLQPRLMTAGIEWSQTPCPYRIAMPEKALLDTYYLATRKGRRFRKLPELEFGHGFSRRRFQSLLTSLVPDVRMQSAIRRMM